MRVSLLLPLVLAAAPLAAQSPAPQSLTLEQAIRLGRSQGVNAALARINERIADARTGQRRADILPSLTAGGSWTRQTLNLDEFGIPIASGVTDPFSLWRFQASVRQTLFDASTFARIRAAKDSALSVGADARAVGELSGASAGIAYLRAVSAEETVRAREADSAVAAALLSDARQLVSAGASPAIDQTRSETQLASVLTQLEIARNQRDRTRLDLARALDLPAGTPLVLADSLSEVATADSMSADAAVTFALEHRAEVQAERGRTEVVRRSLKAMSLEYVPTLAAGGTYTQSGQELNALAGTYALQIGLTWNILDGFRRPARQQEQSARLDAQKLRQHDVEQQVSTEVQQALLDQGSADHQVRLAAERMRLAELELQQARERFSAGVAGSVETTNAQGGLVAARDGVIQARVNAAVARVQVRRALGVLDGER